MWAVSIGGGGGHIRNGLTTRDRPRLGSVTALTRGESLWLSPDVTSSLGISTLEVKLPLIWTLAEMAQMQALGPQTQFEHQLLVAEVHCQHDSAQRQPIACPLRQR